MNFVSLGTKCSIAEKDNDTDVWKYNPLLFFSFLLSLKMYRQVSKIRVKTAELCTQGPRYKSSVNRFPLLLFFFQKPSWLHNIPDAHTNSPGHTSFILPPTHHIWSRFLLAYYPHNLRFISTRNTFIPFTLGNRCISCYFHFQYLTSFLHATNAIYMAFLPGAPASCLL